MKKITLEQILAIHEMVLEVGGGVEGIIDVGMILSSLEKPYIKINGKYVYKNIWEKAAALLFSLIKNHAFTDGNKRTAYTATVLFLENSNYEFKLDRSEVVDLIPKIAKDRVNKQKVASILKKNSIKK